MTFNLGLEQWGIYYLEVELKYKNRIPNYDTYREGKLIIKILHKYQGTTIIQDEISRKIESNINTKYSIPPRIVNIKVLKRLGYGIAE